MLTIASLATGIERDSAQFDASRLPGRISEVLRRRWLKHALER